MHKASELFLEELRPASGSVWAKGIQLFRGLKNVPAPRPARKPSNPMIWFEFQLCHFPAVWQGLNGSSSLLLTRADPRVRLLLTYSSKG